MIALCDGTGKLQITKSTPWAPGPACSRHSAIVCRPDRSEHVNSSPCRQVQRERLVVVPTVARECVRAHFLQRWDSEHPSVPLAGVSVLSPVRENKVSGASILANGAGCCLIVSVLELSFAFWGWAVKSACFVKIRDLTCEKCCRGAPTGGFLLSQSPAQITPSWL